MSDSKQPSLWLVALVCGIIVVLAGLAYRLTPDGPRPPHRHRFEADRVTCYWVTRTGGLSCLRDLLEVSGG